MTHINSITYNFKKYQTLMVAYLHDISERTERAFIDGIQYVQTADNSLRFKWKDEFNGHPDSFSTYLCNKYPGITFQSNDNFENDISFIFIDKNQKFLFELVETVKIDKHPVVEFFVDIIM